MAGVSPTPRIERVEVEAWTVPTDAPEADGTLGWDSTTVVLVRVAAGGRSGLGWTYADVSAAEVVRAALAGVVTGLDALDVPSANEAMVRAVRNMGRPGVAATALSAVDIALWDLKARLLDVSLAALLGRCRESVPAYGSGGFTTWDDERLAREVHRWTDAGMSAVKIKIGEADGTRVRRDLERASSVRQLVGSDVDVFVDANGGYTAGQAARVGAALDDLGVTWFEEPVTSDDVRGLAGLRRQLRCDVCAGEYSWSPQDAWRLVAGDAVDCLQADVTRCGGITGWLRIAALAEAAGLEVSTHCAPQLSAHVAVAVPNARHVEWFHDHVRLAPMLFDGSLDVRDGALTPDPRRPGHGLARRAEVSELARRVA